MNWDCDPKFEPGAIEALYKHSGGIPRRINTLGNRLMILGFLDELHNFTAEDVDRVAADLARETDMGGTDAPKDGLDHLVGGERLTDIEQRLQKQEAIMRRLGSMVRQFVQLTVRDNLP